MRPDLRIVRYVVVVAWLSAQLALIATGGSRPSGAFAFRMFPETSDIEIHLWRRVDGARLEVPLGMWSARGPDGSPHAHTWAEKVGPFAPSQLDARARAPYGARAQLAALGAALDWLAEHSPDDAETRAFGAEVTVWRNGRAPEQVSLVSHERSW
jgi:hypothetical protein